MLVMTEEQRAKMDRLRAIYSAHRTAVREAEQNLFKAEQELKAHVVAVETERLQAKGYVPGKSIVEGELDWSATKRRYLFSRVDASASGRIARAVLRQLKKDGTLARVNAQRVQVETMLDKFSVVGTYEGDA